MPGAPSSSFLATYSSVLAFLFVGVAFVVVNLIAWKILRPSRFS